MTFIDAIQSAVNSVQGFFYRSDQIDEEKVKLEEEKAKRLPKEGKQINHIDFTKPKINSESSNNITAFEHNPVTHHTDIDGGAWELLNGMLTYGIGGFVRFETAISKDPSKRYFLELTHRVTNIERNAPWAPEPNTMVTVYVNGQMALDGFQPENDKSGRYPTDSFDITDYLVDGENHIELKREGGVVGYRIKNLEIKEVSS